MSLPVLCDVPISSANLFGIVHQKTGIDLQHYIDKTGPNGLNLSQIRRHFQSNCPSRNIHIWTPETPNGLVYDNVSIQEGDVHIVVHHGHAYTFTTLNHESHVPPQDCPNSCWLKYPGSNAQMVHRLARKCDPRINMYHFTCPITQTLFTRNIGRLQTHDKIHSCANAWQSLSDINTHKLSMENASDQMMKKYLQEYFTTGQIPAEQNYIRNMSVDYDGSTMQVPVVVWATEPESILLKKMLSELAKKGVIISITAPLYKELKAQSIQKARMAVKEFTRHNDKLGFDYSVPQSSFVADAKSRQFESSAYRKFLKDAIDFQRNKAQNTGYAEYLSKIASNYTITNEQRDILLVERSGQFKIPDNVQHERTIGKLQGEIDFINCERSLLRDQLCEFEIKYDTLKERSDHMDHYIKGLEDKAIIDPKMLSEYPARLRRNLRKIIGSLETNDEITFVRALLDPFHPTALGVRVPSILPRETATYNSFFDINVNDHGSNSSVLVIASFEVPSVTRVVQLPLPNQFFTNSPVAQQATVIGEGVNYNFHYINTGRNGLQFKDLALSYSDTQPRDLYTRQRTAAGGIRFVKTSANENESGQLDMHYSRDGALVDESTSLNALFTRPSDANKRVYLAGTQSQLRSTAGYLVQCNYRPHDDHSFTYRDAQHSQHEALFSQYVDMLWLYDITADKLYPFSQVNDIPDASDVGIVVESLQQRHTVLAKINKPSDMKLTLEVIQHFEGIPEQSKYGFIARHSATLKSATNPFQLIQSTDPNGIFASYEANRQYVLNSILDQNQSGVWDETLFPALKEMVRYGADMIPTGQKLDHLVSAALDTSLATLSAMAPELAPAMMQLRKAAKDPLVDATLKAKQALHDWSISGSELYIKGLSNDTEKSTKHR